MANFRLLFVSAVFFVLTSAGVCQVHLSVDLSNPNKSFPNREEDEKTVTGYEARPKLFSSGYNDTLREIVHTSRPSSHGSTDELHKLNHLSTSHTNHHSLAMVSLNSKRQRSHTNQEKFPKISDGGSEVLERTDYQYSSDFQDGGRKNVLTTEAMSPVQRAQQTFERKKREILSSIKENILMGMRQEAAMLASVLPMIQELIKTPGLFGKSSLLSEKVLGQSQCAIDFERSVAGLLGRQLWAGQMFDAWGKLPPGLLKFFIAFRGEYMECRDVYAPPITVSRELPSDSSSTRKLSLSSKSSSKAENSENHPETSDVVRELLGISDGQVPSNEQNQLQQIINELDSTPALLQMLLAGELSPEKLLAGLSENSLSLNEPLQKHLADYTEGKHRQFPSFHGKFCHIGLSPKNLKIAGGQYVVSVYNKVISGFQQLRRARAPVTGLEPATESLLQIQGGLTSYCATDTPGC
ncbi:hypothetical protein PoB_006636800 [Plakobranchus ocellatus]|uniref:Nose resistant-to-fluoxetine protein N-terminal domain-containing protein n=1 Tax=Plakobranchus ocellatus TaxID=259542 RepID=A0AAV4D728_9GAST|nr:hypothetical protein PoB_006636800 [Plakobranchus ocellatus]